MGNGQKLNTLTRATVFGLLLISCESSGAETVQNANKCDTKIQNLWNLFLSNSSRTDQNMKNSTNSCNEIENTLEKLVDSFDTLRKGYNIISDLDFCSETNKSQELVKELGSMKSNETMNSETEKMLKTMPDFFQNFINDLNLPRNNLRKNKTVYDVCNLSSRPSGIKIYTDTQIKELVEESYSDEDLPKLLKFLERLPWIRPTLIGYKTLYTELEADENLDNPLLLELAYQFRKVLGMNVNQDDNFLSNFNASLELSVDNVLNELTEAITTHDYPKIMRFATKYNESFNFFFQKIVEKRLKTVSIGSIFNMLGFLNIVKNVCHLITGYRTMFFEMDKSRFFDNVLIILLSETIDKVLKMDHHICPEFDTILLSQAGKKLHAYVEVYNNFKDAEIVDLLIAYNKKMGYND